MSIAPDLRMLQDLGMFGLSGCCLKSKEALRCFVKNSCVSLCTEYVAWKETEPETRSYRSGFLPCVSLQLDPKPYTLDSKP